MKRKVISLLVIITMLFLPVFAFSADNDETEKKSESESYLLGRQDAKDNHGTGGWIAAGAISGGLFSWLGTGITVAIAAGSNGSPDYIPEDVKTRSYLSGYSKESKKKNIRAVAIPGVIMSLIWTGLVLTAANS